VLLVAIDRRVHDRVQQVLREAGLTPRRVGVAVHSLARLAAVPPADRAAADGRLVVWLEESEAELAVVTRGRVVASRAFPIPPTGEARARALAEELDRTATALPEAERAALAEILVGGDPAPLTEWSDLPVREDVASRSGLDGVAAGQMLALAVAVERPARGSLAANLLPEALRPRPFPWALASAAILAALALGVAAAIPAVTALRERRALAAIDTEIAQLAPAVQRAERLAAEVERAHRELIRLRDFEAQGLHPLSLVQELTEMLPADVWLTSLSIDRNGIELAGFANAASQLIALLEASPRIERVEFTSPVTKGRDREQFRLKAAWEAAGRAR
jgi:Tfp pilus assembly protein PilN